MEIDKATDVVSAASILLDGSSLQVQAFAAPRTEGIWDEIRAEIAESVTQQGGSADDLPGPVGLELLALLTAPDLRPQVTVAEAQRQYDENGQEVPPDVD